MSRSADKLRVVIADDERPARSFLAAILGRFGDVDLLGEAVNGVEAVTLIESKQPDLALLDLQMPEVDGLGVVRLLKKNRMPLVAFVTAYDEYAVRAFEVNAVDYILKPVERARAYAKPSIGRGNVWSTRNTNLKLRNVFAQPYPTTKPQESGLC